jgi:hypothetical protein
MAIGPRMLGVGGHQPLLNSKDEVVRGVKSGWRHRRVGSAEANLQRSNRLAERLRDVETVIEPESLYVIQQRVRLRHQRSTPLFGSVVIGSLNGRGGHWQHHKQRWRLVKYRFTSKQLLRP